MQIYPHIRLNKLTYILYILSHIASALLIFSAI